jgi:hypothetical protein
MQFAEGAGQAILNEVIRYSYISGQGASVAPQTRNFGFDLPVNVYHERLPMVAID